MTIRETASSGITAPEARYTKPADFVLRCSSGHEWETWGFVYGVFQGFSFCQESCPECGAGSKSTWVTEKDASYG